MPQLRIKGIKGIKGTKRSIIEADKAIEREREREEDVSVSVPQVAVFH